MIKTFLNPEGHQNAINGSKVTAILLKGWILPVVGALAVEGLRSTGLPLLVFKAGTSVHMDQVPILTSYESNPSFSYNNGKYGTTHGLLRQLQTVKTGTDCQNSCRLSR